METLNARADWNMIGYAALAVGAASPDTRIHATIAGTSLIARAIAAENAFGSTRAIRITDVIGRAYAIDTAAW